MFQTSVYTKDKSRKRLGKGSFGIVFVYILDKIGNNSCTDQPNLVAVKKISLESNDSDRRGLLDTKDSAVKIDSELAIFQSTDHPNVVKYFAAVKNANSTKLFLELCDDNLAAFIARKAADGTLKWIGEEKQVKPVAKQIAQGLAYLHSQNIVHRDLKPANILLMFRKGSRDPYEDIQDVTVKISDFGLSRVLEGSSSISVVGTERFMSPEMAKARNEKMMKFRPQFPQACDVFSAGVVFFRMRYGTEPLTFVELVAATVNMEGLDAWKEEDEFSQFKLLCLHMMKWDPRERIHMADAVGHVGLN